MTSAFYLEHYLESLETLPSELQRNFTLMRSLDKKTQETLKDIDALSQTYLKNVKKFSPKSRANKMQQIQRLYGKTRQYGDDKVQLASQTYEMVDKHIRKLDSDLARFESEVKLSAFQRAKNSPVSSSSIKKSKSNKHKQSSDDNDVSDAVPKKKRKNIQLTDSVPLTGTGVPLMSLGGSNEVIDMPVDPNEPTYCICHQVSYGEMIGCDNNDCLVEWFHFGCVGLTTKPKGKWFCPKCTEDRKKNK